MVLKTFLKEKTMKIKFIFIVIILCSLLGFKLYKPSENIIFHTVDPKSETVKMYWKSSKNEPIGNFNELISHLHLENKTLTFAMNGGMYLKDQSPQGLFIENGIQKTKLDTIKNAFGNFYLQPNGVFYLDKKNRAFIKTVNSFQNSDSILYATQSGPMLLINGAFHPKLTKGSKNLHIRNGVGILPNGHIIFAISKTKINFYDFASFFKEKGCKNALYLDGFVSKIFISEPKIHQKGGRFGVIIGTEK